MLRFLCETLDAYAIIIPPRSTEGCSRFGPTTSESRVPIKRQTVFNRSWPFVYLPFSTKYRRPYILYSYLVADLWTTNSITLSPYHILSSSVGWLVECEWVRLGNHTFMHSHMPSEFSRTRWGNSFRHRQPNRTKLVRYLWLHRAKPAMIMQNKFRISMSYAMFSSSHITLNVWSTDWVPQTASNIRMRSKIIKIKNKKNEWMNEGHEFIFAHDRSRSRIHFNSNEWETCCE